jgi:hypothetical protein
MKTFWIAVALVLVVAVLAMVARWYVSGSVDAGMFGGIVGDLVAAIATLALIRVRIEQTRGLARTANADFILRRVDQFFRPETRTLLHLIEDDYLLFQEQKPFQNSYFMVDETRVSGLRNHIKIKLLEKSTCSTYETDDMVLGPWEDLGSLEEEGLISFDLIYDIFSWYICRAWQNQKIRRYIDGARAEREEGKDPYNKLQSLAERCLERERSQAARGH